MRSLGLSQFYMKYEFLTLRKGLFHIVRCFRCGTKSIIPPFHMGLKLSDTKRDPLLLLRAYVTI